MSTTRDSFSTKISLDGQDGSPQMFSLWILEKRGLDNIDRLPFSIRVLREALQCNEDGVVITQDDVAVLSALQG